MQPDGVAALLSCFAFEPERSSKDKDSAEQLRPALMKGKLLLLVVIAALLQSCAHILQSSEVRCAQCIRWPGEWRRS